MITSLINHVKSLKILLLQNIPTSEGNDAEFFEINFNTCLHHINQSINNRHNNKATSIVKEYHYATNRYRHADLAVANAASNNSEVYAWSNSAALFEPFQTLESVGCIGATYFQVPHGRDWSLVNHH